MISGACHCGAVSVSIASKPRFVNVCDCSLCAKSGGVWAYFSTSQVTIKGKTSAYRRADSEAPAVEIHFCPRCGTTTHWLTTERFSGSRMGVNVRVFEPSQLAGVAARFPDGRNWTGETDPAHRRPPGRIGEDIFL